MGLLIYFALILEEDLTNNKTNSCLCSWKRIAALLVVAYMLHWPSLTRIVELICPCIPGEEETFSTIMKTSAYLPFNIITTLQTIQWISTFDSWWSWMTLL